MDYLPKECLVCVSESGRTAEALKGWLSQMKADVTSAMESGILCGPMAEAALPETDFARQLERFPVCQLESLPTSRYLLAPKALLQIDARQLSGYGGSLETAVTDLTHYLTSGCRVMVLCGGQVRPGIYRSCWRPGGSRRHWIWRGSAPRCGTWCSLRWVLCPPDASTRPYSWRC